MEQDVSPLRLLETPSGRNLWSPFRKQNPDFSVTSYDQSLLLEPGIARKIFGSDGTRTRGLLRDKQEF